jgi:hypothetical protein
MAPHAQAFWICLGATALAAKTPGFFPLVFFSENITQLYANYGENLA